MPLAQLVPATDIHYHHAGLIWLLFGVGVLLHLALQVDDIARKNKWSRRAVLGAIGIRVAWRVFFTSLVFGLIWHYPLLISKALGIFGIHLSDDEAAVFAIPMNNLIAGVWGLFLDSAFGYIPGLKSWLPVVDVPIQSALVDAKAYTEAASDAIETAQHKAAELPKP